MRWRHQDGAKWGLLLTLLFVLPAHSGKWTWRDKPLLLAIDTGGHRVSLLASGLIIGAWRRTSPEDAAGHGDER